MIHCWWSGTPGKAQKSTTAQGHLDTGQYMYILSNIDIGQCPKKCLKQISHKVTEINNPLLGTAYILSWSMILGSFLLSWAYIIFLFFLHICNFWKINFSKQKCLNWDKTDFATMRANCYENDFTTKQQKFGK